MKKEGRKNKKEGAAGFAMLYTVVIVSLILSIALSISSISYKQGILSGLAKDSQIAFYQADAGIECALYYTIGLGVFPSPLTPGAAAAAGLDTISCGFDTLTLNMLASDVVSPQDYFIYESPAVGLEPCFSLIIDNRNPSVLVLEARGKNRCGPNPRQIERALRVEYY